MTVRVYSDNAQMTLKCDNSETLYKVVSNTIDVHTISLSYQRTHSQMEFVLYIGFLET